MKITALIPAYEPGPQMVETIKGLIEEGFESITVVDDGSGPEHEGVFKEAGAMPGVTVLRHAGNLGKGAALKTGLNHAYCSSPEAAGVVTLDADGQHLVADAAKVARRLGEEPGALVIGARDFTHNVPFKSRLGNVVTKHMFRMLVGRSLRDTQSGLRGVPHSFIPRLLRIGSNRYEFELDMILAAKHEGRHIHEVPVSTVYLVDNRSSHFNPVMDSMRIYFSLFRFSLVALASALIDYTVFSIVFLSNPTIAGSQLSARLVSVIFNYIAVKRVVFQSKERHTKTFTRYLALALVSGFAAYLMILSLVHLGLPVLAAKAASESAVFVANYAIQRNFIFTPEED